MARTEAQRAKQREASRRYRAKHGERVRKSGREYMRRFRAENPDSARASERAMHTRYGRRAVNLARNTGMSVHTAVTVVATMADVCAICGNDEASLVYDHDHATNEHRGWLCQGCNRGLGQFSDSPELLRAAADYLGD